jgi:hypothetical protein
MSTRLFFELAIGSIFCGRVYSYQLVGLVAAIEKLAVAVLIERLFHASYPIKFSYSYSTISNSTVLAVNKKTLLPLVASLNFKNNPLVEEVKY